MMSRRAYRSLRLRVRKRKVAGCALSRRLCRVAVGPNKPNIQTLILLVPYPIVQQING